MRILVTHEIFPPEVFGGGEKLTLKLVELLIENGHEVKVLTSGDPKIKKYEGIETIRIHLPSRYMMSLPLHFYLKHSRNVDIIQTSSGNTCVPSWVAAKINKKPICCLIHHILGPYWLDVRGRIKGMFFQELEKFFLTRSYDAVVIQNKNSLKLGLNMGIDNRRIHKIHPGLILDYEKFQSVRTKKKPFVLFVGNFSMVYHEVKYKGLDYLIEAANKIPEVEFLIVGGGQYLEKLKKISPKNVKFYGPATKEELIKLYNKALIYCQPSLTEGFGLALQESMAGGCAIISTIDIGESGIIIKNRDADAIANAVRYLINNPKIAEKLGEKNRELVKKFTWKKFIDGYLKIYEEISENKL